MLIFFLFVCFGGFFVSLVTLVSRVLNEGAGLHYSFTCVVG